MIIDCEIEEPRIYLTVNGVRIGYLYVSANGYINSHSLDDVFLGTYSYEENAVGAVVDNMKGLS